jgi:hypothetical protein
LLLLADVTQLQHILPAACIALQDACNSNASFDLTTDQMLSAISEMERAQEVVKVSHQVTLV